MHEISITNNHLFNLDSDIDSIVKDYKEAGIDGVDFPFDYIFSSDKSFGKNIFKKNTNELKEAFGVYKKTFKKYGISVYQTHSPFPAYSFKDGDEEFNEFMVDVTRKCIELTAYLGAKYIVVHPPKANHILQVEEKSANINFYSKFIDDARSHGITICLENMWMYHSEARIIESACANPYEACDYIDTLNDMVGEELFGFCFDLGHANICGRHIQNSLRILGKRVKVLHIHDTDGERDNHALPYAFSSPSGAPITDYRGFLAGLRDIGYEGSLNFECHYTFNSFPKSTHPALYGLLKAIGDYFSAEIKM